VRWFYCPFHHVHKGYLGSEIILVLVKKFAEIRLNFMSVGVILHIRKNTSGVFSLNVYILDSLSVFSVHAILCIFGNDLVNKKTTLKSP